MNLEQVIQALDGSGELKVPEWLPGAYRRQYIHFHDGRTDSATRVFWLQSGGLTIDLRLPANADSAEEPRLRYQGWCADSVWQADQLSWENFTSLHQRDLWPEPAILDRVGLHLIERAPSGVYLEDWLALQAQPGPLAGFRLKSIKLPGEADWRECGGALIVAGDWVGQVIDLRAMPGAFSGIDGFVTWVGRKLGAEIFVVCGRLESRAVGADLALQGQFSFDDQHLRQEVAVGEGSISLRYEVDQVTARYDFQQFPEPAPAGRDWYQNESGWLGRR